MGQMTNKQARVIDPILSEVARGYSPQPLAGMFLFPRVGVLQRGGNVITFGKEAFMAYANLQRAPGQNTKRMQVGYSGAPYALVDYSLEGQVPFETQQEGMAVPGIDVAARTIQAVQDIMYLRLELAQASLATTAANYASSNKTTLSGSAQWSDYSGASHPIADIEVAKEAVRAKTGKRANTAVISAAAFAKLKAHPDIIGRLVYTQREIATPELLAMLFGLDRVVIGEAITATDAGVFGDVWGKDVVVAYTKLGPVNAAEPSYGYTYMLEGYPDVEEPYQDRNAKSTLYPVTTAEAPQMVGAEAGYVIKAAVA